MVYQIVCLCGFKLTMGGQRVNSFINISSVKIILKRVHLFCITSLNF